MKDRNYLIAMYNATSTDDGKGHIETYESWLERQLLSRIETIEKGTHLTNIDLETGCCTICGKNLSNERAMFPRNCTPEKNCLNNNVSV